MELSIVTPVRDEASKVASSSLANVKSRVATSPNAISGPAPTYPWRSAVFIRTAPWMRSPLATTMCRVPLHGVAAAEMR